MFGKRLRTLRKEQNLTQKSLGEKVNVSDRVIGYYETDERFPDKDTLSKIADYFDVSVDYLLGRTDERKNRPKLDPGIKTIAAKRINVNEDLPDDAIEKINDFIRMVELDYKNKK